MKSNCVCIIFVFVDDNLETITVRGCALDSGTLTTDTEIIRMSHCGKFYYDERWNYIIEDKFPFQFNKKNCPSSFTDMSMAVYKVAVTVMAAMEPQLI